MSGARVKTKGSELARRLLEKPVRLEMERPKLPLRQKPAGPPKEYPAEILVDDFDTGLTSGIFKERKNSLGSYQGTWAMRPSFSIITKSSIIRRGDHGQALVIEYRKEAGWCGWYTLLNNIDVTPYNTLSFWVRGEKGGEKFDIGLADARMQDLEIDAFFLGSVTSFISDGFVTTEWKEVKVPLSRASSAINLSKMGSMVFWFKYGGEGRIYVDDIKFKNDPDVLKMEEYNAPQAPKDPLHPRALWVWKIDPVNNPTQRKELFELCQRTNINVIYLFFPEFTEAPDPYYIKSMAEFLKESHKAGVNIEALTGNPVWSLAVNHQLTLNWIKFFLEYNKDRPQEERINGVSLDVEPYLTAEWEKDREMIKKEYLELLAKCRALIDSYGQEFKMGVAIPFFYDKEDDGKFERSILENVDYIALMDYYDTAKDIIDRARFHIQLAKELNKKVFIGVETQDLVEMRQGKRRNTFIEEGWEEMERQLEAVKQEFLLEPSFEGFAIHCYYSYRLMTRGRNVPTRERKDNYLIKATRKNRDITIDGKLDDWDLSNPYTISEKKNVVYGGGAWKGPQDTSYKIYTQWDEEAFYIAVDITDDIVMQEKKGADMWEGDHVELWLDVDCLSDFTEAVNSDDDYQIGLSPGNFQNIKPEAYIWIPSIPDEIVSKNPIEIASTKKSDGYIIEARIPSEILLCYCKISRVGVEPKEEEQQMTAKLPPEPLLSFIKGFKLGIMVDVGDQDDAANPMKLLMSTSIDRVWGDPTTFGMVEFE
ncbi:MAG: sugar-binding protein [Candidatus Omnitrophica bacterium]|nr:sugar-binding protein [Candidatus Omnitrophota bacterium]